MHDEREIHVEPRRCRGTGSRSRSQGADDPDVRSRKQIMLHAHDGIIGALTPGLRIEHADAPRSGTSVEPATRHDGDSAAGRVQSDAPRIEHLSPFRRAEVKLPTRLEEELPLFREEEREAREVNDLLVGLHLREVGAGRDVRRERQRDRELRIEPRFGADEDIRHPGADAVVCRFDCAAQHIVIQLHVTGPTHVTDVAQLAGSQELIQPFRATPGAPEILFVLAPNETAHVEAEPHIRPVAKARRAKRNPELGRPSRGVARHRDVPDAIPVLVEVVEIGQLCVPAGAIRVRAKHERAAAVVEAVDDELDIVVARQAGVAPQLGGADATRCSVVRPYADVEGAGIAQHADDGSLGRRLSHARLTLAEVRQGVGAHPIGLIQPAVEPETARRRPDTEALRAGGERQRQR